MLHVQIYAESAALEAASQIEYCVTDQTTRPTEAGWFAAYIFDGKAGILVEPGQFASGQHVVWYRVE
ncbi:hypothetical protein [Sinomonas gamaensis]|uniref:hypothetical protein n=1 Tax=Sinomonas gamaensis TaxID=2565624 RepID=UPI001108B29F|nr:hypothetical protein [Sinomonas gamaensis]